MEYPFGSAQRSANRVGRAYMGSMSKTAPLTTLRLRRAEPILVCKKCLKRIDGGSKLKRALKSEVKRRGATQAKRRSRIVMTGCFGICPKRAVVVASGSTLRRGEYLLLPDVDSGTEAVTLLLPSDEA
jgi:predicted metal-binding protein